MDNDFPVRMAGGNLGAFLQQYESGVNKYSQGGTDIPNFTTQSSNEDKIRYDQILGIHLGIIIPINRKNEEEFHYF